LRALYLAWLAAYGIWERDEDAFDDEDDEELETPVPAGLATLTAPQRTLARFLRLDDDLLTVAAQASPPLAGPDAEPGPAAGSRPRRTVGHLLDTAAEIRPALSRPSPRATKLDITSQDGTTVKRICYCSGPLNPAPKPSIAAGRPNLNVSQQQGTNQPNAAGGPTLFRIARRFGRPAPQRSKAHAMLSIENFAVLCGWIP
jgi:hypothetical protein